MKIYLLFLLTLISLKTFSAVYLIDNKEIIFLENKDQALTMSEHCRDKNCLALKKLDLIKQGKIKYQVDHDLEPGAWLCEKSLDGQVVIGHHEPGENSFCRFSDGSLIDTGSLHYWSLKRAK